ncbi:MAG: sporulation protein YabP [Clostridiales bacterium]|nr:sporulation protein YabP [Clostridiales bacterium]
MEKTVIKDNLNISNEKISLVDRKKLSLEGVLEVISSNENGIFLKLKDTHLTITGKDIHIERLDIGNQILECNGHFESFKYGKSGNIFKRLFK